MRTTEMAKAGLREQNRLSGATNASQLRGHYDKR
nr:MAG TPA: hypothetical protein [Caudoviricetes sp.]